MSPKALKNAENCLFLLYGFQNKWLHDSLGKDSGEWGHCCINFVSLVETMQPLFPWRSSRPDTGSWVKTGKRLWCQLSIYRYWVLTSSDWPAYLYCPCECLDHHQPPQMTLQVCLSWYIWALMSIMGVMPTLLQKVRYSVFANNPKRCLHLHHSKEPNHPWATEIDTSLSLTAAAVPSLTHSLSAGKIKCPYS